MPKDHFLFYTIISSYFIDCLIFDNIWLNSYLLRGTLIGETGEIVVTPGFQELICHFQNCKAKVCRTNGSKVTGNLVLPGFNSWRPPCYYIMSEANIDFFLWFFMKNWWKKHILISNLNIFLTFFHMNSKKVHTSSLSTVLEKIDYCISSFNFFLPWIVSPNSIWFST